MKELVSGCAAVRIEEQASVSDWEGCCSLPPQLTSAKSTAIADDG